VKGYARSEVLIAQKEDFAASIIRLLSCHIRSRRHNPEDYDFNMKGYSY